jgi:hypothetical protein
MIADPPRMSQFERRKCQDSAGTSFELFTYLKIIYIFCLLDEYTLGTRQSFMISLLAALGFDSRM